MENSKVSMNGNIERLLDDEEVEGTAASPATNDKLTKIPSH